jgi:uncharacterized Tic20 family protein
LEEQVQVPEAKVRTMGMLTHLISLVGLIIPLGNLIGPLVVWLMKKDEHPFIDENGKESVNFQISLTIYLIISGILALIVIGFITGIGLTIFWIVVAIKASIQANKGESYRYPLTIRFIK